MGLGNTINTMINTGYDLLISTCFYLMAMTVIVGAISALFSEFGVVNLLNWLLFPLMKPLYGLPGAAALGVVSTYLSENPAILSLANDKSFRSCFRAYQIPALANIGTAYGMGLVITTYMMGFSKIFGRCAVYAALCGNAGAIIGSIVSTRLMLKFTKREMGLLEKEEVLEIKDSTSKKEIRAVGIRLLDATIQGGTNGVKLGMEIIPGVLVICTFVMMLTYGAPDSGVYSGAAYEGIGLIPLIADKFQFFLKPLFGFTSPECASVPMTAVGSVGASLGIVSRLVATASAGCNDIAVFTAMGMCWSGYLSTHVAMMNVLGYRDYTGKAITYHTIGGICAGIVAHWLFALVQLML